MPASYKMASPEDIRQPSKPAQVYRSNSDVEFLPPARIYDNEHGDSKGYTNGNVKDTASKTDVELAETSSTGSSNKSDKKEKAAKLPMVGVTETFRYSTGTDKFLIFLGILAACAHGAAMPVSIIIFGNMSDSFIDSGTLEDMINQYAPMWMELCNNMSLAATYCGNMTAEFFLDDPNAPARLVESCIRLDFPPGCDSVNGTNPTETEGLLDQVTDSAIVFVILGCIVQVLGYIQVLCWQTSAYNQAQRVRIKLFRSILKQEIGWFDTHEVGELNNRMSDDVIKIEAGIGEKLGLFFQYNAAFLAGIIIGFVYSWKLTLVILSVSPLLILSGMAMGKVGAAMTSKELQAYAKAGAVAEEVFGAIRTVLAFGGEAKECKRYDHNLVDAREFGVRKGMASGLAMGLIFLVMFGSYALGFWYGSTLVFADEISPGDLLTVFFSVLIGTFSIGSAAPNIQDFSQARGAAHILYAIIENEPLIDSSSNEGKKDVDLVGNVEFRNVHFNYPSRPDVKVLQGLSLDVRVGQTVALCGSSGCGKSTTVQLLQRFYDPKEGQVLIDGTDIREYNVRWLRQQIGVVSQEPVLFATSIAENIRYGRDGVSQQEITDACKQSNAHDFIMKLPKQYETLVGERGAQLSGGQKQRIAIARALVRKPKIILLDEATSALDTESEATVQAALDVAGEGRTTLVIAHRLSTIRNADVIVGVRAGQVAEHGTHDELMNQKGLYHELVLNQQSHFEMDDEDIGDGLPAKPGLERALSNRGSGKFTRGMSTMSAGSALERNLSVKVEEEKVPEASLGRIMQMNAPEWPLILGGCICAIAAGSVQPAFAIIFSDILGFFSKEGEEVQDDVNLYAGMFAVIGAGAGLAMFGMNSLFSRSGEYLTMRLRQLSFQTILKQEMAYFDDHQNSVGALCTRLATDASAVQGATGVRLGMFCQSLASIGAGIVIGFIYSWELTLLILGFGPFLLGSGFIQMRVLSGNQQDNKKALERAGKIAVEAIENIRTVATLTREQRFLEDFENETIEPFITKKKKAHIQGVAFGFSQAIMFMANAACFTLGAFLVENKGLAYEDMFKVFMAVVFGAVSAGQASSFAPDYSKAKVSAGKMFQLFDRVPAIDTSESKGRKLNSCQGNIKLRDVHFNYPTRPNVPVLRGLDVDVTPGQTVALVGSSGCGKSTTVQLLERFYDPHSGIVSVEGVDICEISVPWLRSQMGIVSQEPMLFDSSIRENIAYGDNSREVSMGEIIEAAKNANIHNFIEGLPQGYDTNVGDKGAQLSGGQKQRVAIARALVRNPKILLLDEATSALDTESEKVVQAALDRAQEGRTCIVIAHRLSTIQNSDNIVVIHQGKVVEQGRHAELLQRRGRYYKLNNAQLKKN